jgi:hypothetical protein
MWDWRSPLEFSHNAYYVNDDGTGDAAGSPDTSANGAAYAKVFSTPTSTLLADTTAGPGAGTGAFGTFGVGAAAGTLLLDLAFGAGGVLLEEMSSPNPLFAFSAGATPDDIFRSVASGSTQAATLGFLDVIGGAQMEAYDTNGLFAGDPLLALIGRTAGFDARIEASNSSSNPPLTTTLAAAGWNSAIESSSVLAQAPEPGSLALVGAALLAAGFAARRRRNS